MTLATLTVEFKLRMPSQTVTMRVRCDHITEDEDGWWAHLESLTEPVINFDPSREELAACDFWPRPGDQFDITFLWSVVDTHHRILAISNVVERQQ